jgi:hypothetical protein
MFIHFSWPPVIADGGRNFKENNSKPDDSIVRGSTHIYLDVKVEKEKYKAWLIF